MAPLLQLPPRGSRHDPRLQLCPVKESYLRTDERGSPRFSPDGITSYHSSKSAGIPRALVLLFCAKDLLEWAKLTLDEQLVTKRHVPDSTGLNAAPNS